MRGHRLLSLSVLAMSAANVVAVPRGWAQEYSHVRIVRLSFVEGTVNLQRPGGVEWAQASVNTPIQEGFKVATSESSFAEVEFENSSTVRIGQLSLLEFDELLLSSNGDKVNRLTLHEGYATFHVVIEQNDVYEVRCPYANLVPTRNSLFRLDLEEGVARVEVFRGSVEVTSPYGSGTLGSSAWVEIRPQAQDPFQVGRGIAKDEWDEWVEEREEQLVRIRARQAPSAYPSAYGSMFGWADLLYYGGWSFFPGYGYGWFPRVPIGWAPYSFGRWVWYPFFGLTWISFEPWGWLPYHYGLWGYIPSVGWGWFPDEPRGWSPARVNWYRGDGWIGWRPRMRSGPGAGEDNCPNGQPCGGAMRIEAFQNGQPVRPETLLPVDLTRQGRPVPNPDVRPTRFAFLPGAPTEAVPHAIRARTGTASGVATPTRQPSAPTSAPSSASTADREATLPSGAIGSASGSRPFDASEREIVFDPAEGRFVNRPEPSKKIGAFGSVPEPQSSGAPPEPQSAPPAPGPGSAGTVWTGQTSPRPAPRGNYPAVPTLDSPAEWRTMGGRHQRPADGISLPESGVRSGRQRPSSGQASEAPQPNARPTSPQATSESTPSSSRGSTGSSVWRSAPSGGSPGAGRSGGASSGASGGSAPRGGFGGGPSSSPGGGGQGSGGRAPR